MHSLRQRFFWIALALTLGACAVPPEDDTLPPPPTEVSPEGQAGQPGAEGAPGEPGATASGLDTGLGPDGRPIDPEAAAAAAAEAARQAAECPPPCEFPRDAISDPSSDLASKVIYFDYDQSEIRQEFLDLVAAHGRYLATYPDVKVRCCRASAVTS